MNTCQQKWHNKLTALAGEIQMRHYSPKTLKSYRAWVVKFQLYLKYKNPDLLDIEDVKKFLTYQAVNRNIAASSKGIEKGRWQSQIDKEGNISYLSSQLCQSFA